MRTVIIDRRSQWRYTQLWTTMCLADRVHCCTAPIPLGVMGSNHLIVLHNTRMPTCTFSSQFYHVLHYKILKVFFSVWRFCCPQLRSTRWHFHLHIPFWARLKGIFLQFDPLGLTPFRQDGPFWYGCTHIIFLYCLYIMMILFPNSNQFYYYQVAHLRGVIQKILETFQRPNVCKNYWQLLIRRAKLSMVIETITVIDKVSKTITVTDKVSKTITVIDKASKTVTAFTLAFKTLWIRVKR